MSSLTPESRSQLLSHLRAEQSARWGRGERARVEQFLEQYPDLAGDTDVLVGLITSEILLRLENGDQPDLQEYLERFPGHSEALLRAWQQLQLLNPQLASHGGAPDTTAAEEPTAGPYRRAAPPLSLPGLELHEKLGEGGMGVVYRARDVRLDRPRAVKLIRAGACAGQDAHDRFNREARAVARLDHPGVVRIYSLGEHEDHLYICMEFLEGGNLQTRLRQGPLEVRAAAELVRQLALAVQHAHESRVLHRDLKPANVLLGADGAPRVADFGLAKLLDADDDLTQTGVVMGTPSYMAPEQAEGRSRDVGEQTDVYALGAILYECLAGKPPFRGETRSETMELVKKQPAASLRQFRVEVPAELDAICLKCLEKQPAKRHATAAELAAELQDWLDGKPARARSGRGWPGLPRGVRRRPLLTVVAGVVILTALTAGLLGYFVHPDRPLWQARAQLRRGEALELVGATGKPRWSRWWLGEKNGKTLLGADGTFVVHGWPLTLLELLPDTSGQSHYRIHAEIRHIKGGQQGAVGFYFAGTTHRETSVPVLSFLCLNYNDLHGAVDGWNRLPPHARKLVPKPKGNRVRLTARYYADSEEKKPLRLATTFVAPELFGPAGHATRPGEWRTVRVEISPSRIRAFWDDRFVGEVIPSHVEKRTRESLRAIHKREPDNLGLEGLVPGLDPQGGLGLYLYESYASFRHVRVEPFGAGGKD